MIADRLQVALVFTVLVGCSVALPKPRGQFSVERTLVDHTVVWSPVSPGLHPLLVLLPAMGGTPSEYKVIAEELASFGYVVAGITEERVPLDLERRAEMQPVVDRWANDAIQLLDRIPHVDKNRVGVFGHSFGGAVAIHLLQTEPRFRRGANLDGATEGSTVENLTRPILFLNGAALPPSQQALNDKILAEMKAVCNTDSGGCEWKDYPEAGHMNFSDQAARTLEGVRFLHQVSDDLLRFFSRL